MVYVLFLPDQSQHEHRLDGFATFFYVSLPLYHVFQDK